MPELLTLPKMARKPRPGGRLQIGMVAGFKSERWPKSNRNTRTTCVGIRKLIRARTGEGRKVAKARGVKMGRKPKLTAHQQREALRRRDARELPEDANNPDVGETILPSHMDHAVSAVTWTGKPIKCR